MSRYAYIVWAHGPPWNFSIGDLTFLAGSFRRLRNLLENLLLGFSQSPAKRSISTICFSFFEIQPEIRAAAESAAISGTDTGWLHVRERWVSLPRCRALGSGVD